MAEETKNLSLKKPAQTDFYNVDDFNENFQKIDDYVENQSNTNNYFGNHTINKENPHGVTKEQIGLGNVPNKATNDQVVTYTEASTLTNLASGDILSTAFGKIKKAITDLIAHIANKSNPHGVTKDQIGLGKVELDSTTIVIGADATKDGTTSLVTIGNTSIAKNYGVSVGSCAATGLYGVSIGHNSYGDVNLGVALGSGATVKAQSAIQLGAGTNSTPTTLQVFGHQLLDSLGKIPDARLSTKYKKIITGSYVGTGTYVAGQETQANITAAQNTIQFTSYPRMVFVKRRTEDFWTIIAPNPEDNTVEFISYGGNNYSGGLCSGKVTSDYKLTWYANVQKWSYKADLSSGAVSMKTETIASDKYASLKPVNQLNWEGETYDYLAICD